MPQIKLANGTIINTAADISTLDSEAQEKYTDAINLKVVKHNTEFGPLKTKATTLPQLLSEMRVHEGMVKKQESGAIADANMAADIKRGIAKKLETKRQIKALSPADQALLKKENAGKGKGKTKAKSTKKIAAGGTK